MKFINKLLVFLSLSAVTGASIAGYVYSHKVNSVNKLTTITSDEETVTMTNGVYTFTLNKAKLYFEITKGSQTWNSGKLSDLEPATTDEGRTIPARERLITNPVTIFYLLNNSNTSEASFSLYDKNQAETSIRVMSFDDFISARVSVLSGRRADPTLNVAFTLNYYLMDNGLKISISDIEEEAGKGTLSRLALYPGFGMSYLENDGKFLIPDGSGALIDLSVPSLARSQLQIPVYDKDIGISSSKRTSYSTDKLSIPMYAAYDSTKTMITTIEKGSEFAELNVKRNGMVDKYNNIYYCFTFKEIMTYEIPGINTTIVQKKPQEQRNNYTPEVYYHLYDEHMEYYDIAKKYQEHLVATNVLRNKYANSSLRLEFLMAENKKAFIGTETYAMTTVSYVRNKVSDLINKGHKNLSVSLLGYSKGGYLNSLPNAFPIEKKTGSEGDYASLGGYLKTNNINLNYVVDVARSFQPSNSLALGITQNEIVTNDYINGSNMQVYRMNPSVSAGLVNGYKGYISAYGATGFDFTSIGSELFSTYHREYNSRTDSMNKYVDALKKFEYQRNMKNPNFYMYPYFENYLNAPVSSSGYLIESESIPFIQMVLSGYKSFYSSPINNNYIGEKQLVELIDYNVNPSYLLTQADTINLIDSPSSSYIYSSQYENWEADILNAYSKVNRVLKQVEGLGFIKREKLTTNVYKNTYENGKVIVVNYTSTDYDYNGHNVAPLSGEVFEA